VSVALAANRGYIGPAALSDGVGGDLEMQEEYQVVFRGGRLSCRSWAPRGAARAAVAFVHGFGEHAGRYEHVGARLAAAGMAFCAVDLPGHGRSAGKRGVTSYPELLDVVAVHLQETGRRHPGLPVILYGHSMGGALVLRFAWERKPELAGVIASSPLIGLAAPASLAKVAVAMLMRRLMPRLVLANPLILSDLSRDASVGEQAGADPLYHNMTSTALGVDILRSRAWFQSVRGALPVPLLLMQGTADRIVDARETIALAGRLTGDVILKTWDGFYHELHNEPEKDAVLDYLVSWIETHALARGK
jgi:alpha-beta hydrolase superfamily lysophospholipase